MVVKSDPRTLTREPTLFIKVLGHLWTPEPFRAHLSFSAQKPGTGHKDAKPRVPCLLSQGATS